MAVSLHEREQSPSKTTSERPAGSPSIEMKSRWPRYEEDEIAAVTEVLRSGRVNALVHGERCSAFEAAFAKLCDMPHAIALANGTLALELALRAFGIGPGDEVIVTPRSFVASASCVVLSGATPVFADVDPISQNITAATVEAVLSPRTRAIIAVHLAGYPCALDDLAALAAHHGLRLIEDCAQAHGATYNGRPVGSFGDAAAFSFCTDKIMSTGGEGGLLLLKDHDAWLRAWSFKDHGKDYARTKENVSGSTFRWLHSSIGSNYRMTEMQAAIGLRQLTKLNEWVNERRRRAALLLEALEDSPALRLTRPSQNIGHAYYKFYAFVRPERLARGWSRDRIVAEATAAGVPCQSGICPEIYREQAFVEAGIVPPSPLPMAQQLGATSLMLPVDPTLSTEAVRCMGTTLSEVLAAATV